VVPDLIIPDEPAPPNVRIRITTRAGGRSVGPYTSFNLGDHVGDDPVAVAANRALLNMHLSVKPLWLKQVHGTRCIDAAQASAGAEADASFTRTPGIACAVLTADCLPVLLCDTAGSVVAAVHAGWRGLAAGIIETTVTAMSVPENTVLAWLGPAIGPDHFEVGSEVREAFITHHPEAAAAFTPHGNNRWLCNLYQLARQRLAALGVHHVASGDLCTMCDHTHYFSYRRDGTTGRMASLIWLAE
jgi:YfiH family protein